LVLWKGDLWSSRPDRHRADGGAPILRSRGDARLNWNRSADGVEQQGDATQDQNKGPYQAEVKAKQKHNRY
jgi:hypothetical protein